VRLVRARTDGVKDVRQWKRWGGWKAHLYDGEIPLCPLPNGNVRRGLVLAVGSVPSVLVTLTGEAVSGFARETLRAIDLPGSGRIIRAAASFGGGHLLGPVAAVSARPGGRVLAREHVIHADSHELRQPEGQDGRWCSLGRRGAHVQRLGDVAPAAHPGAQEPGSGAHVGRFLRAQAQGVHDATASPAKSGSIPSSNIAWTSMLKLKQSALQSTSLTCAVGFFDRTDVPNYSISAPKVLSTFERAW
jgi:hypothetical protein